MSHPFGTSPEYRFGRPWLSAETMLGLIVAAVFATAVALIVNGLI